MARKFYCGQRIYDCETYREGKVVEIVEVSPIEYKLKLVDENYNHWWVKEQDAYIINEELSKKYNFFNLQIKRVENYSPLLFFYLFKYLTSANPSHKRKLHSEKLGKSH